MGGLLQVPWQLQRLDRINRWEAEDYSVLEVGICVFLVAGWLQEGADLVHCREIPESVERA